MFPLTPIGRELRLAARPSGSCSRRVAAFGESGGPFGCSGPVVWGSLQVPFYTGRSRMDPEEEAAAAVMSVGPPAAQLQVTITAVTTAAGSGQASPSETDSFTSRRDEGGSAARRRGRGSNQAPGPRMRMLHGGLVLPGAGVGHSRGNPAGPAPAFGAAPSKPFLSSCGRITVIVALAGCPGGKNPQIGLLQRVESARTHRDPSPAEPLPRGLGATSWGQRWVTTRWV
ncbi:hypothetical protein P7K49_035205 [Saguinus oedipus]|uniref:Uncharacterized protein n=1 Tax=Saguinus oedipus TaxID=9490 RepID=A0ABQ9TWV9_SAGOE|nr:hypothetical protein P7K49_035205 [Saguinus oedipus]